MPSMPHPAPRPADEVDVAIVGAGAAGIGAARRLTAAGLTVAVLEARTRVGGRAVTVNFKAHPVDLGAHWLHAGPINPLVRLGRIRGEPLRRAPVSRHLVIRGRFAGQAERIGAHRAFKIADRVLTTAARQEPDRPMADALPWMGRWGARAAAIHALVSGRPLAEVSLHDFPSGEYASNRFIAGGLGAYLKRLSHGIPVSLGAAVRAVDCTSPQVRIVTDAGSLRAQAVIVTVPMAVLQQEAIRFTPPLPSAVQSAIGAFLPGVYDHVVLHWPSAPFRGPDRLASLIGHRSVPGMLTRIDGSAFHYFELDYALAQALDRTGPDGAARYARAALADHFGAAAIRDLTVMTVTAWRHDPWSRASWAVVPPGHVGARDSLKAPVGDRLWLAGEALSRLQWGTAGGAWQEGERAADAVIARLGAADLTGRERPTRDRRGQ